MSLRMRRIMTSDEVDRSCEMDLASAMNRNAELEEITTSLRQMLDASRLREKKLVSKLEEMGCLTFDIEMQSASTPNSAQVFEFGRCPMEQNITFMASILERGGWLIGLLVFQSFSSIILSENESLLSNHPSIIFFLTMLVGAGKILEC